MTSNDQDDRWSTLVGLHMVIFPRIIVFKFQGNTLKYVDTVITFEIIREYCTPNQKLARFVPYLKIFDIFLKNDIYVSYSKLSKELKIALEVCQVVLELLIKIIFWLFWSITYKPLDLLKV